MKELYVLAAILFLGIKVSSQNQAEFFELSEPCGSGSQIYEASSYIKLQPGFISSPTSTEDSFWGLINPFLIFPPSGGTTGGPITGNNGVVGSLPGILDVSGLGAATYNIPINLPKGVSNLTPGLSLSYNSQAGNGLLGMGWNLVGISSITRVGTNLYFENFVDGVDFDNLDKFALDGMRLIPEGSANTVYHTEIEDYSSIIVKEKDQNGNPVWFQVMTKDGRIIEYGRTENSKNQASGREDILSWTINRIEDRKGNYIVYNYSNTNNCFRLINIQYGGHKTDQQAIYNIDLQYNERPDKNEMFVSGSSIKLFYILSEIKITHISSQKLIWDYILTYEDASFYSKIASIELSGLNGSGDERIHYNPTTFTWGLTQPPFSLFETNVQQLNSCEYTFGDFNGDGKTDLICANYEYQENEKAYTTWDVYYANSNGIFSKTSMGPIIDFGKKFIKFLSGDFNGDGLSDLVKLYSIGSDANISLSYHFSTGSSFSDQNLSYPHCILGTYTFLITDLNGNGVQELFEVREGDTWHTILTAAEYNRVTGGIENVFTNPGYSTGYGYEHNVADLVLPKVGDFNGDGLSEILVNTNENESTIFYLHAPDDDHETHYLHELTDQRFGFPTKYHRVYTGDFNGDGITDILTYAFSHPTIKWQLNYFNGKDGWVESGNCPLTTIYDIDPDNIIGEMLYPYNYLISDYNGDGKSDIIQFINGTIASTVNVHYSDGLDFALETEVFTNLTPYASQLNNISDFNGDGKAEIFILGNIYDPGRILSFHKNETSNLIDGFTNGLGVKSTVNYAPLTNNMVYTKGSNSVYPIIDLQPAIHVVRSRYDNLNGNNVKTVEYKYGQLKAHVKGKGMLGYGSTNIFDCLSGLVTEIIYDIYKPGEKYFYPYAKTTTKKKGTSPILEVNNTLDHKGETNSYIYFPYILSSFSHEYEYKSLAHVKTKKVINTYGDYNNLSHSYELTNAEILSESELNGAYDHEIIIDYTYKPADLINWLLSEPDKIQQTVRYKTEPLIITATQYNYYQPGEDDFPLLKEVFKIPENISTHELVLRRYFEYDEFGNITLTSESAPYYNPPDPLPPLPVKIVSTSYNSDHRFPTTTINPANYVDSKTYDPIYGQVLSSTDINNLITNYITNPLSIDNKIIYPDGIISQTVLRWANGHPLNPGDNDALYYSWSKTSKKPEEFVFYNENGLVIRIVTKDFKDEYVIVDKTYDSRGRLKTESVPYKLNTSGLKIFTDYTYDNINRATIVKQFKQIDPVNQETISLISNDYCGNQVTTTYTKDGVSQSSKKRCNAMGWLNESEDNAGKIVKNEYRSDGLVKTSYIVEQPLLNAINILYNAHGMKTSITDPNYGTMSYTYDAYDQLILQVTPKQDETTFTYDILGRILTRTEPEEHIEYLYNETQGKLGTLFKVTSSAALSHSIEYTYDSKLKIKSETEIIDNVPYTTYYEYDKIGRTAKVVYPSEYEIVNCYNDLNYLKAIKSGDNNLLWECLDVDDKGQVTSYKVGNGLQTTRQYDPNTFRLRTIMTQKEGQQPIQDLEYDWDEMGNLDYRKKWIDRSQEIYLKESFSYDNQNRLNDIYLNDVLMGSHTFDLDGLGNIKSKQADGKTLYSQAGYGEEAAGPNAFTSASTSEGIFPIADQIINYTSFDKVKDITEADKMLFIYYGISKNRIKQEFESHYESITKVYVNGCEFINENGQSYVLTYLTGPTGIFGIVKKDQDGYESINYIHTDHLGSVNTITDMTGNLLQELSFDAWGVRRDPNTWRSFSGTIPRALIDRGYTGHEHLYAFNLINMNGRMYDPTLGRMLSVDNFIQAPDYSQNFNRYSYCLNNPLKYTDPTGDFFWIPVIIGAVMYGTFNTIIHYNNGDIHNFWEGLGYFAQGAITGAVVGATWSLGIAGVTSSNTLAQIGGYTILAGKAINAGSTIASFIKDPEHATKILMGRAYIDENRSFLGGIWQGLSRYTWEGLQTWIGYNYTQARNASGKVDKVQYFGGVTFGIDENVNEYNGWRGVSMGNYINAKIPGELDNNYPKGWIYSEGGLFWHEYGHTTDSQIFGLSYLFIIGLPSALGAEWTETRANIWAWRYAKKHEYMDKWMYPYVYPL